jgi:hypothetical protein
MRASFTFHTYRKLLGRRAIIQGADPLAGVIGPARIVRVVGQEAPVAGGCFKRLALSI